MTLPYDNYELELTYNYNHEAYDLGNGYGHIAISVDNLEELHTKQNKQDLKLPNLKGFLTPTHAITLLLIQMAIRLK